MNGRYPTCCRAISAMSRSLPPKGGGVRFPAGGSNLCPAGGEYLPFSDLLTVCSRLSAFAWGRRHRVRAHDGDRHRVAPNRPRGVLPSVPAQQHVDDRHRTQCSYRSGTFTFGTLQAVPYLLQAGTF